MLGDARPPLHLTPLTRDREVARDWFERFEGAGLDGVIAKPAAVSHHRFKPRRRTNQPMARASTRITDDGSTDCG